MGRPRKIVGTNKKHFTMAERTSRLESEEAHRVGREELKSLEQLSDRAKAEFERIKTQAYWLDNLDRNDLQMYAFYYDKILAIIDEYDSVPEVLKLVGADGGTKLVSNPLRKALRDYTAEMRAISLKLGTVASRPLEISGAARRRRTRK